MTRVSVAARSSILLLLSAGIASVGCSSSGGAHAASSSSPASAASAPATTAGAGTVDSSVSDASGTADPTTDPLTGETAPTTTTETIATATLDSACVHKAPSPDRQGLTVHIAPGATVGYSTEYDDESNELTNPSYTTGFGFGTAGPDGIYRATWPVPANAPVGLATVTLAASEPIQESVTFTVAAAMGPCP